MGIAIRRHHRWRMRRRAKWLMRAREAYPSQWIDDKARKRGDTYTVCSLPWCCGNPRHNPNETLTMAEWRQEIRDKDEY